MPRLWLACRARNQQKARPMTGHDHTHSHHAHDHDDRWKHDGVRVIPGNQLDTNVPSTAGMDRAAAINFARVGAAVAINLDIEPVEKPETVLWIDPVHRDPNEKK